MKKLHMLFDSIGAEEQKMNERKALFKWASYTVSAAKKWRRRRRRRRY